MKEAVMITRGDLQQIVRDAVRSELALMVTNPDPLIQRSDAMQILAVKSRTTMLTMEANGKLTPIRAAGNRIGYRASQIKALAGG